MTCESCELKLVLNVVFDPCCRVQKSAGRHVLLALGWFRAAAAFAQNHDTDPLQASLSPPLLAQSIKGPQGQQRELVQMENAFSSNQGFISFSTSPEPEAAPSAEPSAFPPTTATASSRRDEQLASRSTKRSREEREREDKQRRDEREDDDPDKFRNRKEERRAGNRNSPWVDGVDWLSVHSLAVSLYTRFSVDKELCFSAYSPLLTVWNGGAPRLQLVSESS